MKTKDLPNADDMIFVERTNHIISSQMKNQVVSMASRVRYSQASLFTYLLLILLPSTCFGFTQYAGGGLSPMGHEWITRLAWYELFGGQALVGDPVCKPGVEDERNQWTEEGRAFDLSLPDGAHAKYFSNPLWKTDWSGKAYINEEDGYYKRFGVDNLLLYSAIMGERWVDLAGFFISKENNPFGTDCWSPVNQENADVQYHHFMRKWNDVGPLGGIAAAKGGQAAFKQFFTEAAMADSYLIPIEDGGLTSNKVYVERCFFLLGRAIHVFQDAFSPEHTVRTAEDSYRSVREVKAYLCSEGSEQHTHSMTSMVTYGSGDVIWKMIDRLDGSGWNYYNAGNMRTLPLVATEATKDVYAAFLRVRSQKERLSETAYKQKAREEADRLIAYWLSFSESGIMHWYEDESHRDHTYVLYSGQSGPGNNQDECLRSEDKFNGINEAVNTTEETRLKCLFNILPKPGHEDLFDAHQYMPLVWAYNNQFKLDSVPAGWSLLRKIPGNIPIKKVRIKSIDKGKYLSLKEGGRLTDPTGPNVECGTTPLEFYMVGDPQDGFYLRFAGNPIYFLSVYSHTGTMVLWPAATGQIAGRVDAKYQLRNASENNTKGAIFNTYDKQFMSVSSFGNRVAVDSWGGATKDNSQWIIEEVPLCTGL